MLVLNKPIMRMNAGSQVGNNSKLIKSRKFGKKCGSCREVALMKMWLSNLIVWLMRV